MQIGLPKPFDEFVADIACLGVSVPVQPDLSGADEYAILAARSNPRWWLLPLSSKRAALSGLSMFQPVTRSASLLKRGLTWLIWLGARKVLLRETIHLKGQPKFGSSIDTQFQECSYFTGTEGPHRKTAVQLIGANGAILGYAKVSRNPLVQRYVRNEAAMLAVVGALDLRTAETPSVLAFDDQDEYTVLVTDTLKTTSVTSPILPGPVHVAFLNELASKTTHKPAESLQFVLKGYHQRLDGKIPEAWLDRFRTGITLLEEKESLVPQCFVHGDFTQTNSFELQNKLYVFDWEYAMEAGPVGYDYAHYVLARPYSMPPQNVIAELTSNLANSFFDGQEEAAQTALLCYLLLHAGFYLERAVLAGLSVDDWEDGFSRSVLLDTVFSMQVI